MNEYKLCEFCTISPTIALDILICPVISRMFELNGWKLNTFWTLTITGQLIYIIFLHYQVNLNRPCPFWPDDGACALRDCSVAPCKEVCDHVTLVIVM